MDVILNDYFMDTTTRGAISNSSSSNNHDTSKVDTKDGRLDAWQSAHLLLSHPDAGLWSSYPLAKPLLWQQARHPAKVVVEQCRPRVQAGCQGAGQAARTGTNPLSHRRGQPASTKACMRDIISVSLLMVCGSLLPSWLTR